MCYISEPIIHLEEEKYVIVSKCALFFCLFDHCHCYPYSALHLPFDENYMLRFAGAVYLYGLCHIQEKCILKLAATVS